MVSSFNHFAGFVILIPLVASTKYNFFPNLPAGEYKVFFKAILKCAPATKYDMQYYIYLSKSSANTTEIKGNLTSLIPFDDSLDLEVNMAVKDSIGGWKDNAIFFKKAKACSTAKHYIGDSWIQFLKGHGINNVIDCPIPAGNYTLSSLNTFVFFERSNLPKIMFYGSYKAKIFYTKKNKISGCNIFVVDVKRPWETE